MRALLSYGQCENRRCNKLRPEEEIRRISVAGERYLPSAATALSKSAANDGRFLILAIRDERK